VILTFFPHSPFPRPTATAAIKSVGELVPPQAPGLWVNNYCYEEKKSRMGKGKGGMREWSRVT
jgi:hypothetical protein